MAFVNLQPHLANLIGVETEILVSFSGEAISLKQFLDHLFLDDRLFRYSLTDETGALRRHITVFIDNKSTKDLTKRVSSDSTIFIVQALSGG